MSENSLSEKIECPEFPFFGAGHAHYFEWAEVQVRFARTPTKEEKRALLALIPPIFAPEGDGDSEDKGDGLIQGRMLTVGAGQFVNMYIERAYGGGEKGASTEDEKDEDTEEEEGEGDDDTEESLFFVSPEAAEKFENAIETWLRNSHEICPIEFAVRAEDGEAGGTELSSWHEDSLAKGPALVERIVTEPLDIQGQEKDWFVHALGIVLDFCEIAPNQIPSEFVRRFFPATWIERAFERGEVEAGLAELRQHPDAWEDWGEKLVRKHTHYALKTGIFVNALTLLHFALEQDNAMETVARIARAFARELADTHDSETAQQLVRALSGHAGRSGGYKDCDSMMYLNEIAAVAHSLMTESKWVEAIALFRLALQIECPEPAVERLEPFCNALYPLQNDNSQLPVDAEQNAWFLERCLPYAPKNPAIYFNALCLYVEMGDFAKAAEFARLAEEHGSYDGLENMKKQIATLPMFAKFRESKEYSTVGVTRC